MKVVKVLEVRFHENMSLGSFVTKLWSEATCPKTKMVYKEDYFIFSQEGKADRIIPMSNVASFDVKAFLDFEGKNEDSKSKAPKR